MYIDHSGFQGFMPQKGFDRKKIGSIFIQMRTKGVTEGMAGDPLRPAKLFFVFVDVPGKVIRIDGFVRVSFLGTREKPAAGPAAGKPVLSEQIGGIL